jgi:hypothetical protein
MTNGKYSDSPGRVINGGVTVVALNETFLGAVANILLSVSK